MGALIGIGILLIGAFLLTVSAIWGALLAFQENVLWGLMYLFIPIAGAISFVIVKWHNRAVRVSYLLGILGTLLLVGGGIVSLANGRSLITRLGVDIEPVPVAESSPTSAENPEVSTFPAEESEQSYRQTMSVGYAAYQQGDYQTALINFRRALVMQPGDRLATEAIQNTEAIIQQQ